MPKIYTHDELAKLIGTDKMDELAYATKDMSAPAIRANLSNALGDHIADNYDLGIESAIDKAKKLNDRPLLQRATANSYEEAPSIDLSKLYESKIETPPKLKIFNQTGGDLGYMDVAEKATPTIHLNEANLNKVNPRGVILHEGDHIQDMLSKGFIPDDEMKVISTVGGKGLKAAEDMYGQHHGRGFFELEALKKLMNNKKLQAAIPIVGAGLTAYSVLDSGNVSAADPTGILQSDDVGEGSDEIPDQSAKDIYNARMKKTKQLMGDQ